MIFFVFVFTSRNPLVTIAAKSKPAPQGKDKENISANDNNNRAILAVALVQKPPLAGKPTMLKNVLKKSMSGPTSAAAGAGPAQKKTMLGELKKSSSVSAQMIAKKPIGQRQFEYAEAQKKRKELLVQKMKEQEDLQLKFHFHANPVPKFKKVPMKSKQPSVDEKKLVKENSLPQIQMSRKASKDSVMVPSCGDPDRLKYFIEKKKMLVAKYQEPQKQFKAKPAAVLKKQPFQPVHNTVKVADPKPFKLQLTERLLQRSEFDKKLHETIAIRKKQEDVRNRQQALEDRKLIRQKTEFRANPNPFRSYHY